MVPTDLCRHWNRTDTLQHRLTECGEGPAVWEWTRQRIANGSEANTRRMATTPRPQIVAPETSPRCIMGTRKLRNVPSATATNTNAT